MPFLKQNRKAVTYHSAKSWTLKGLLMLAYAFILTSILGVFIYRWVNPNLTMLMVIRHYEFLFDGKSSSIQKDWESIDNISPNMVLAAVAAEDSKFLSHWGFDFELIREAMKHNQRSTRIKGASTISQQTAKNIFLWPRRSWVRKGFEAYFTVIMETLWPKKRIMEVYLNIVEFGKGVYGVEEAAQKFYRKPAVRLNRLEAAMLTSVLPRPSVRNPANPSSYMYQYQARVLWGMSSIVSVDFDSDANSSKDLGKKNKSNH